MSSNLKHQWESLEFVFGPKTSNETCKNICLAFAFIIIQNNMQYLIFFKLSPLIKIFNQCIFPEIKVLFIVEHRNSFMRKMINC